jgi:CDP-diglyceride synthetase
MSNLGIETMPAPSPSKKKTRWSTALSVFLGLMVAFFLWVVVSNTYVLYFGKPLINLR